MRIERDPFKGYRVYLGDGKRGGYKANDEEELIAAVKHHFGKNELGEIPGCPLCRAIHAEMAAMGRGSSWRSA
ncbi:hypothetical protein LCGC14_0629310 [marine sediment metagenome]|uniref:Uncharacterized protein n=1 Tax=marine sediment metagenome TaxID=412755 RepID=A0A0F9TNX5_9ZZZZ